MLTKNKPYDNFVIVTKRPSYSFHSKGTETPELIEDKFEEEKDKTFWIYEKDGSFVGRYSVKSAPQWIMRIYRMLVG